MKLLLASLLVLIPFTVHADHLGNLSANEFDPNSTASPYGAGSPYLQTASRMSWASRQSLQQSVRHEPPTRPRHLGCTISREPTGAS